MTKLTLTELAAESVELLPSRETLAWDTNMAVIMASNMSIAANVASLCSTANSTAVQLIAVHQG